MSPRAVTFAYETANFLILAGLLSWFFFRPVRDALERRRAAENAQLNELSARRSEVDARLAELEQKRVEIAANAGAERDRARAEGRAEAQRLIDAARAEAQRERERSRLEGEARRASQVRGVALDAARAARELVARLLQDIDGPELEAALVGAACVELSALAAPAALRGVRVDSARPLPLEALARLARAAGVPPAELDARISTELLAGVRISTSRGLVDASVAGIAAAAERALAESTRVPEGGDGA